MDLGSTFLKYLRQAITGGVDEQGFRQLDRAFSEDSDTDSELAGMRLFEAAGKLPGHLQLGYALGQKLPLTAFGPLGSVLRVAPTPRDWMQALCDYQHLVLSQIRYELIREAGGTSAWSVRIDFPLSERARNLLVIGVFSLLDREVALASARSKNFTAIELRRLPHRGIPVYERHFGLAPTTDMAVDRVLLADKTLDQCNPVADPESFRRGLWELEKSAEKARRAAPLDQVVRDRLMAQISDPPAIDTMAESLHMSARQLQFGLEKCQTNYRQLMRQCRLTVCDELLDNPNISVSEIAYRLGYSEVSAFTHSFTRWTGVSPRQYRESRKA